MRNRNTKYIGLYVTPEMKKECDNAAKKASVGLSYWIRDIILLHLSQPKNGRRK